jgi:GNAT superfamily N-acetyltransferase
MTSAAFSIQPLQATHERNLFRCGSDPLDRYLREQASQDCRRRIATCFIASSDEKQIAGYYTLASASVPLNDLPETVKRKLPRYPSVPAVRMGRLAVALSYKGKGLGGALLADALLRAKRAEIAAYALIVDAKDEAAVQFYRHHAFVQFPSLPSTLFLPFSMVA